MAKRGNRISDSLLTSSLTVPDIPGVSKNAGTLGELRGIQTILEDSLIVLDTVPEAYAHFDSEFRLTFVNQAAKTLFKTRN